MLGASAHAAFRRKLGESKRSRQLDESRDREEPGAHGKRTNRKTRGLSRPPGIVFKRNPCLCSTKRSSNAGEPIDDDELNRRQLVRAIENAGYEAIIT